MEATNHTDILIAVITATILFFLFSVFTVIYFLTFRRNKKKHQQEMDTTRKEFEQQLLQSQIEVQESTYRHIAKELHDNVGQLLSTTKMLMGVTELKMANVPETLLTANTTLSRAIQELRALSRSLDKEWLEQFNFLENLQCEIDRINALETVCAKAECTTQIDLEPEEQIILFRIAQEAIHNALRHASPSYVYVNVSGEGSLEIKVINNGNPLPVHFYGMGTNNMRQRVRSIGGSIDWDTKGGETIVTILLPLNAANEN